MRGSSSTRGLWRGLLINFVCLPAVTFGLLFNLSCGQTPRSQSRDEITTITPFVGLPLEASGVTTVPASDGVLIVDNGRNGQVFWMQLDPSGKQVGAIKAIELGVNIEDIEGI